MKRVEYRTPTENQGKEPKRWPVFNLGDTQRVVYHVHGKTMTEAAEEQLRHWKTSESNKKALATPNVRMAKRVTKRGEAQAGPRTDADCYNTSSINSSSISSKSDTKGGGYKHETPDTLDATAASSSSAATAPIPLKALKGVREPRVFPAAGTPVSTGESLAQSGQIKPNAKATGLHGSVVDSGGATGASSKDGVCGQAAAEHCQERKEGSEAKGLSEEDPEVEGGGGFDSGPDAELARAVTERDVEGDGDSTVGPNGEEGADSDSVAPCQAGKLLKTEQGKSSRSDNKGITVMEAALTIVIQQLFMSTRDLQCSSLPLNEACRRAPTLVVMVGGDFMPLERLAGSKKNHEAGEPPATAGDMMTRPGLMPESKRVPQILPRGLVWCLPLDAFGQGDVDLPVVRYLRLTETAYLPEY
ncbi:unnamed protein product, partial [Ectocarpus sp. 4 AP-2014]